MPSLCECTICYTFSHSDCSSEKGIEIALKHFRYISNYLYIVPHVWVCAFVFCVCVLNELNAINLNPNLLGIIELLEITLYGSTTHIYHSYIHGNVGPLVVQSIKFAARATLRRILELSVRRENDSCHFKTNILSETNGNIHFMLLKHLLEHSINQT